MPPHPSELLTENFALIKRAVSFACRRYRLDEEEAEDLASKVNEKLIDDDYAVLRTYQQRSQFSTWISVVVQRVALDLRITAWGKWHASAEAKRLGPAAIELEQLVHRDGHTLEAAFVIVMARHAIAREELKAIVDRLPDRERRPWQVELQEATLVAKPMAVDDALMEKHRHRVAQQLSTVLSGTLRELADEDRLILQLRFERGMTVAQIARSLQLEQKSLYSRIKKLLGGMRETLFGHGIDPRDVDDLIGRDGPILDFDLRNRKARPSNGADEDATASPEGSP